jgi:DNA modification methylase
MIEYVRTKVIPLDELTPYPGNARRGKVGVIKESLERNGQYRSLVVREIENGPLVILAGNHTHMALIEARAKGARCEVIKCDDATARRINIVDNRASDLAEDDTEALSMILAEMEGDYAGTGFTDADVSALLAAGDPAVDTSGAVDLEAENAADALNTEPPADVVTKPGDVWLLGNHRIMCGDCRKPGDVSRLLSGATVNLAFTSPPYASQRKYDETSGFTPVPPDEYVEWFAPVAANVAEHLADDGSWFVNIKAAPDFKGTQLDTPLYVFDLVIAHVRQWGWLFATEFCWERTGMPKNVSRRFKNQFEPIYQFSHGTWKMRPDAVRHASNDVPVAGGSGSGDTHWADRQGGNGSVFGGDDIQPGLAYPGNRLPTFSGSHTPTGHTAAFPVGLPRFFVLAYTDAGDAVYDPFMGSGSTLLAADQEDRTAYGVEISPGYVDVICRRFQQVTGTVPVLESTGLPHSFVDSE